MSLFFDMFVVALLTPVSNYVNNKKCEILERHSPSERQQFASHWVSQTEIYGDFVIKYLDFDEESEL